MSSRLFAVKEKEMDKKYSLKISPPQYLPSKNCPTLVELCDKKKYSELMRSIKRSNIPDDVKDFLRLAATRHLAFRYDKIADYYSHADEEVQKLMEESALVIIDIDDAIANGYVKLSKNIEKIMNQSGRRTDEE